MVMNCGMDGEKNLHKCTEEIPEDAGYFSIVIAKGERKMIHFVWSRKRCCGSDHSTRARSFWRKRILWCMPGSLVNPELLTVYQKDCIRSVVRR